MHESAEIRAKQTMNSVLHFLDELVKLKQKHKRKFCILSIEFSYFSKAPNLIQDSPHHLCRHNMAL